jgi:hypothetical protein
MAGVADHRRSRFSGVVDKDEPVDDLVAVGLLVVLDPHDAGRVEVQFGQPALREREKHEGAQQDRLRHLLTAAAT